MTNDNASRANGALRVHIQDTQDRVTRLYGLISAVQHLDHAGACEHGRAALIDAAAELAFEINTALDTTSLPKEASQ